MATQNSTITVKGKLGNIVGYKGRDGKRLARIRQTEVKNPKTDGQIIQRMILATASKAYGLMKSICDHSWQGVSYGSVSQSYFLKKAMEQIRTFVAESLAIAPETISDPLKWIGLARPDSLNEAGYGLQISEGTIPSVKASYRTEGEGEDVDTVFDHFGNVLGERKNIDNVCYTGLGASAGDQITAVAILSDGQFVKSRYVLKDDPTTAELAEEWDGSIDSGAFDQTKSILNDLVYIEVAKGGKIVVSTANDKTVLASAIIISRKVNDVWKRSTQYLMPAGKVDNVPGIIALWQLGTTEIPTNNPYYLNNADH